MTSVAFVTNAARWRSNSMPLYAKRLADAFDAANANVTTQIIDPWFEWHTGTALDKLSYYANRLLLFPAQLTTLTESDVVHALDHAAADVLYGVKQPAVVTVHDLIPVLMHAGEIDNIASARISAPAWFLFRRSMQAWSRAKRIIAVSQATADDVMRYAEIPASQIEVVLHGVDEHFFGTQYKTHPGIDARPMRLLSVGNLNAYKNVDRLIDAWLTLRQRGRAVTLRRVGPLTDAQRNRIAKAGATEALLQVQGLAPQQLVKEYQQADLLGFPSLYEGFGWPPLECMATGTPAVTSTAASLKQTAGPAALIENPRDVKQVADTLEALLFDPGCYDDLAQAGWLHAQQFRWDTAARHTADIYQEVLTG